jgi:hypothetical protein
MHTSGVRVAALDSSPALPREEVLFSLERHISSQDDARVSIRAMIRYALRCSNDHRFESWFGSSDDFDRLKAAGMVTCEVCGGTGVEKDLMAPRVAASSDGSTPLSGPASPAEQALAELRRRIEASSEDVGRNFAREARRIHAGEASARPIIGEARVVDARALLEDGIPVAPLPWPRGSNN